MEKIAFLKWDVVDHVLIGYGRAGKVPDMLWNQWVVALQNLDITHVLNGSAGSLDINSVQRMRASEVLKARNLTVAVVTDTAILRGMVTAVSWFIGNRIKAFSSDRMKEAIAFLEATNKEDQIISIFEALKASDPDHEQTNTGA